MTNDNEVNNWDHLKDWVVKLDDQQAMEVFLCLLHNRISVNTRLEANEDGLVTHEVLEIRSGPYYSESEASELDSPLTVPIGVETIAN